MWFVFHIDLMLLVHLLMCAEQFPSDADGLMQSILMQAFYTNLSLEHKMDISHNNLTGHICVNWTGVKCVNGMIKKIIYSERDFANFQIQYVPPGVEILSIMRCKQSYEVRTRCLPAQARFISLEYNRIYGSIDLRYLPPLLKSLYIYWNRITGTLDMTNLPRFLINLALYNNLVQQKTLYVHNIPENLATVDLTGPGMRIKEIRSVSPDEVARGRAVFFCPTAVIR